jgi:predicted DNA-binding transcriptional regulator AlpA
LIFQLHFPASPRFPVFFPANSLTGLFSDVPESPEDQQPSGVFFMAQRKSSFPEFGFVRLPQILACIPVCESAWWEGCRTGRYPKPVKLGPRTTAWRVEDIKALIERLSNGEDNVR